MIKSNDLIERFYNEVVKDKYPELSLLDVQQACRSLFIFLRRAFCSPILPKIRFMYFGEFIVTPEVALRELNKLNNSLAIGRINQERKDELTKLLQDYLAINPLKSEVQKQRKLKRSQDETQRNNS